MRRRRRDAEGEVFTPGTSCGYVESPPCPPESGCDRLYPHAHSTCKCGRPYADHARYQDRIPRRSGSNSHNTEDPQ